MSTISVRTRPADASDLTGGVGDRIVATLAGLGVEMLAGFPGETSLPLYLATQRQSAVRHILARCPRCAGYLADGYARISGHLVACDAPGGIGSPFAAPALLEAYNTSVPLLLLVSGVARGDRGRNTTGECDQQRLFAPVCKHITRIELADGISRRVREAATLATQGRPGPVVVEIPSDVLAEREGAEPPATPPFVMCPPAPGDTAIRTVAAAMLRSRRTVIVAGGGVHSGSGVEMLRRLVQRIGLEVATTLNGKGAVDERLPNAVGVVGTKGTPRANRAVAEADCIVAIGTKLGDKTTSRYAWPRPHQTLVHVDIDADRLCGDVGGIAVHADAGEFLHRLDAVLIGRKQAPVSAATPHADWAASLPAAVCRFLSGRLGEHDVVVADASVASGWAGSELRLHGGRRRLITPRGSGSLGYALPAALGAQLARPEAQVYGIGGDSGFAMAMHEMETAVRYKLPIVYFLLNDQHLGLIDRHAVQRHHGRPVSEDFTSIRWRHIAAAFGWKYHQMQSAGDICTLSTLLAGKPSQPTLIECTVTATEPTPDFPDDPIREAKPS